MSFKKYQHVERLGNQEVDGILSGECWIFHKLDGTNASVWFDGGVKAGSRNRELSIDNDNHGFCKWAQENENLKRFFAKYPQVRLYGEWLVKHSFKDYEDSAWRKFYVFDVITHSQDDGLTYLPFNEYAEVLDRFGIEVVPPICAVKNPSEEFLNRLLVKATFKVKDGAGPGEGIVIKNYDFKNRYGRTIWAKIVRNEFKANHFKNEPPKPSSTIPVEQKIVDKFLTNTVIEKVYANLAVDGWKSSYIPRLLNTVYYDLVRENAWDIVKKFKNPKVDFSVLNRLTVERVKQVKSELF